MKMGNVPSAADIVYRKIKKQIFSKKLLLGQKIVDTDFVEEFRVSKTPVREAFLRLKSEGLLEIHPRSGTFVFKFSRNDLSSLVQARICIEEGALRCAYLANPVHLCSAFEKSICDSRRRLAEGELDSYLELDKEFHNVIFRYSKNAYLESYYNIMFDKINILRSYLSLNQDFIYNSVEGHSKIAEYVANDEIDAACRRLREHITNAFNDDFLDFLNAVVKR